MSATSRPVSSLWRNLLAGSVVALTLGVAHLDFDPLLIGGSPLEKSAVYAGAPNFDPPLVALPQPLSAELAIPAPPAPAANIIAVPADDPNTLHGVWAIKMTAVIFKQGFQNFGRIPDYTATLYKQERIGGALGDGQTIDLKVRHEPFSVYMKWLSGDAGRQLIYVDGQNDGQLLVQPGGIKGRLTGLLKLDPLGTVAMSECRYPITMAGLVELARTMQEFQNQDIARSGGFRCSLVDHQKFDERPCYLYTIEYDTPETNPLYRKSLAYVDKEFCLPVCVKNYGWVTDANPEKLDEESLLEFYAYTELKLQQELNATDFDQTNSKYKLRVK